MLTRMHDGTKPCTRWIATDAARFEIEGVGLASDGACYGPLIGHRDLPRRDLSKDGTVSKSDIFWERGPLLPLWFCPIADEVDKIA
jgi:hypothetical protein